jgi:hypothetical protein
VSVKTGSDYRLRLIGDEDEPLRSVYQRIDRDSFHFGTMPVSRNRSTFIGIHNGDAFDRWGAASPGADERNRKFRIN